VKALLLIIDESTYKKRNIYINIYIYIDESMKLGSFLL
jgi:hypothetical protein